MRFTLRQASTDDAPATSRLLAQLGYRVDVGAVRLGGSFHRSEARFGSVEPVGPLFGGWL
jgi:hypothetical protein